MLIQGKISSVGAMQAQPKNALSKLIKTMKTLAQSLALVCLSLPLLASAGNKAATGSMQVSFVVKEACSVQTAAVKTPTIACQLSTPYLLTRAEQPSAAATSAANTFTGSATAQPARADSGAWTLYF